MAEITTKRTGELLRGVFKILLEKPDGVQAKDVLATLANEVPPTTFENSEYPKSPGIRRFEKIVRFATVGCVKAGWLEKSKGRWTLTDTGRSAYKKFPDPEEFRREVSRLYKMWEGEEEIEESDLREVDTSPNSVSISFENAEAEAWTEIMSHIDKLGAYDFQNEVVPGLLRGMGYFVSWTAPPGADGGVDIIAHPDPLGVKDPTIKVSVRKRMQKADVKDIREFLSRLHPSEVGMFISVSGFTKDAEKECRAEARKVRLLDLDRFFELWVEHYNSIPDEKRKFLPLRNVFFLDQDRKGG